MTKIRCPKCRYTWNYTGKSKYYCSCPRCRKNIKIKKAELTTSSKSKEIAELEARLKELKKNE